jgi:ABC-type transport system substrate-binding protein
VVDDHVTLEKNPDYQGGPAAYGVTGPTPIDRLIFRDVKETSNRAQAVVQGEIQIARIVEPNVAEVEGQEGVTIIATPKAGTTRMYLMNMGKAPTDDINVRKAVNMAIDKQAMLQLPGWAGYGRPGVAPLPSNMVPNGDLSSLVEFDIPYDLEGAKGAARGERLDAQRRCPREGRRQADLRHDRDPDRCRQRPDRADRRLPARGRHAAQHPGW